MQQTVGRPAFTVIETSHTSDTTTERARGTYFWRENAEKLIQEIKKERPHSVCKIVDSRNWDYMELYDEIVEEYEKIKLECEQEKKQREHYTELVTKENSVVVIQFSPSTVPTVAFVCLNEEIANSIVNACREEEDGEYEYAIIKPTSKEHLDTLRIDYDNPGCPTCVSGPYSNDDDDDGCCDNPECDCNDEDE